jgi:hypothetical protein
VLQVLPEVQVHLREVQVAEADLVRLVGLNDNFKKTYYEKNYTFGYIIAMRIKV